MTKRFWTHCAFVLYYTVSRFKDKAKTLVLLFFFLVDNNRNIFKNLMTLQLILTALVLKKDNRKKLDLTRTRTKRSKDLYHEV